MEFKDIKEKCEKYSFQNYGRLDVAFDCGKGMYLYDTEGKKYLDLVAGIAVSSIGYSHPKWVSAMQEQVGKLIHVSNLYYIKEQVDAAEKIASVTPKGLNKVLFVNSGAEANEASLKLAVRYTGKKKILSALNSFHGRTAGSLGATGQTKYQSSFEPLISNNYVYCEYGNVEDLKKNFNSEVAAAIIEPIQGEGGVVSAPTEFFKTIRDLCTDSGALMIVDEVQTGFGRTGKWFGIENYGVVPDVITMAKAMGSGVPVGAIATTDEFSSVLSPGTHGTTFGGNPLVTKSVSVTIDIMKEEKLIENSMNIGNKWMNEIKSIKSDEIVDVRGKGLILGIEMKSKASEFRQYCMDNKILVNVCHGNVVRLIPPLIIDEKHTEEFNNILTKFLK